MRSRGYNITPETSRVIKSHAGNCMGSRYANSLASLFLFFFFYFFFVCGFLRAPRREAVNFVITGGLVIEMLFTAAILVGFFFLFYLSCTFSMSGLADWISECTIDIDIFILLTCSLNLQFFRWYFHTLLSLTFFFKFRKKKITTLFSLKAFKAAHDKIFYNSRKTTNQTKHRKNDQKEEKNRILLSNFI